MLGPILLIVFSRIFSVNCLNCYQCSIVNKISDCQTSRQCPGSDQICYTDVNVPNTQFETFSLGCRPKSACTPTTSNAIIGRRREVQRIGCNQCCDTDDCNARLCRQADNFLLFTDTNNKGLYVMDLTTQNYDKIPVHVSNPIAVDYDPVDGNIYWTDVGFENIRTAGLDGSNEKVLYDLGSGAIPDGVAVDPISRLLFYSDTGNKIIAVMHLNGTKRSTIIGSGLNEPRALALDTKRGVIYWTDWGSHTIESAHYDGNNRRKIITTGLRWPNGLAIDSTGQKLYWSDGGTDKIEVSNVDGSGRNVLLNQSSSHLFGIAVLQNNIYFTDWQQRSVMTLPIGGSTTATSFGPGVFGRLNDIHVHKSGFVPSGENGCTTNKFGCEDLCIPDGPAGVKCICADGAHLQHNRHACS